MNYIICKNRKPFEEIGNYNYCNLENMILPNRISFDTETTSLTPRTGDIFCVQIGTQKNNYIIVLYDDNYEFEDVRPYIEDKILVGHNILFDLGFCYKHGFYPKEVRDTMIATRIIYNGQRELKTAKNGNKALVPMMADFGSVMYRELGVKYDKTEQKNIHRVKLSQPSTIKYAFNDVDRLLELCDALEKKIDAQPEPITVEGLKIVDGETQSFRATYDLHCRYIKALAYMERCGLAISSDKWKAKMLVDETNVIKWKATIEEFIFDNIPKYRKNQIDMFSTAKKISVSISSPKQMLEVFKEFKIPVLDADGKESINEMIISKSKHIFVKMWLDYQEAQHRVSTFGDTILQKITGERVYTNFNPMVDTARLSTRKGEINFLNFPRDHGTRDCFIANPGNTMVVSDFNAQEGVIMADLSGDEAMTASVVDNVDLHCLFAKVLFPELEGLSDEEIMKNHKEQRQAAKVPRFLFSYGGNAYTLHVQEGVPMARAEEIDKGFKELHKGLYAWGDEVYKVAIEVGYIESSDGWKLALPEFERFTELREKVESITKNQWGVYRIGKEENLKKRDNSDYIIKNEDAYNFFKGKKGAVSSFFKLKSEYSRLCLNAPVQTRGAHQLKLATCWFFEWIQSQGLLDTVLIDNTVHDEIVAEAPEFLGEQVAEKLSGFMVGAGNHYLTNLKIKAEAHCGPSWGEAK